ncbi:DUF721 domain-containing protein [Streptomyces sp. C10-9-1]|nr:DciA family protein [Streptomyces sp. C10-9-1]MCQ6556869.1 DUF721 domain-containing protein [Streptomyces sp. C10-9-1]
MQTPARMPVAQPVQLVRRLEGGERGDRERRTGTSVRRDGREPLGLGAAITMMMTERGLVAPAAGGSVLTQWETILAAAAPELAGHVQAVKFDADTGRLDVAPDAPAYGTKVRWSAPKLIAAANEKAPGANVRTVHVLPPAPGKPGPATAAADPASPPPAPAAPAPRPAPSAGYRRALAAHQEAAGPRRVDPAIAKAVERQAAAMRELSRRAFPEPDVVVLEDAPAPIEQARAQRRRQAAATEAAALRRARAERAGAIAPSVPTSRQRAGEVA